MLSTDTETRETEETGAPRRRSPRRWGRYVFFALLIAGLPTSGFFLGRTLPSTAPATTVATTTQITVAGESGPTVITPTDGQEPVAAVAAALSPSVVQLETEQGLGSGVIYDSDGLILTAAHVLAGDGNVSVVLVDGTRLEGTVVGVDDLSDVGVVKVDHQGLPTAPLAVGEELQVGQLAVAIGSPFGLSGSVTAGVVSAVAEPIQGPDGTFRTMIQTDAAINPGNSGGALANREGEVIGINDAIFSTSGGNEGIGFAIPIDVATSVADRLVAGEQIRGAFLGIEGTDPTLGQPGALIRGVFPGSPAAEAGIEVGDLIVSFDGKQVEGFAALAGKVTATPPGEQVTLGVVRGGQEITITATLAERS